MNSGDIIIASFPYADLITFKAWPAGVVNVIQDNFNDVIISLITFVVPDKLGKYDFLIRPDQTNNLKKTSIIKVGRIATVEEQKIKVVIRKLSTDQLQKFKSIFKSLVV